MVRRGAAWAYREQDPQMAAIEQEARAARRGLWALQAAQIESPWTWRQAEREGGPFPPGAAAPAPGAALASGRASGPLVCAGKRYCRQMTSCAEARFYQSRCGVGTLDGNHDGIPCEALCGRGP
jgi:hypothetical protein